MGLTRITSDGITDATIATADLADQSVTLAKLPHGTSSNDGKFLRANNGADPTFETVSSVGGGTGVDFNDNVKARFGTSNDLELFHDGTNSYLKEDGTGALRIAASQVQITNADSTVALANFTTGVAVQLLHGGTRILETASTGILVDTDSSYTRIQLNSPANTIGELRFLSDNLILYPPSGGSSQLNYGSSKKLETTSGGVSVTGSVICDTNFRGADNVKLSLGDAQDLEISHDGTNNVFKSTNGEIRLMNGTEYMFRAIPSGANRLYFSNDTKAQTTNTGFMVNGDLDLVDNNKARFGTGNDLELFFDGTHSRLKHTPATGDLVIQSDDIYLTNAAGNEYYFRGIKDGAVEVYHNHNKKFETTSGGVSVTGTVTSSSHLISGGMVDISDGNQLRLGNSQDMMISHDGSSAGSIRNATGELYLRSDGIRLVNNGNDETYIKCIDDGAVEVYHNNNKKFETTSSGVTVTGSINVSGISRSSGNIFVNNNDTSNGIISFATNTNDRWKIDFSGHFVPANNNDVNIGSSSKRVANVYTNDLNLSNEGGSNDVDGTWGSYTIQEGEESLFLINKRNGKKYKFNLTEVS